MNMMNKGISLLPNGRLQHLGKWNQEIKRGFMRPAVLPFENWWEHYIQKTIPPLQQLYWSHGAIFSVSKELIYQNSLDYYQNLLECLVHPNPEEGHYMERSWYYIFNCGNLLT